MTREHAAVSIRLGIYAGFISEHLTGTADPHGKLIEAIRMAARITPDSGLQHLFDVLINASLSAGVPQSVMDAAEQMYLSKLNSPEFEAIYHYQNRMERADQN